MGQRFPMKVEDFKDDCPGELVPVEFEAKDADGRARRVSGHAFVPRPLPPVLDRTMLVGRLYDVLDRAKTNLLRLEAAVEKLPAPKVLLAGMRTREAQASSKIEDTFASLRDIAEAELESSSARVEAVEVYRNRRAIETGLASPLPVSRRLLNHMHRVLVGDAMKRPGEIRQGLVCIGDEHHGFARARFVPPPAEHVERCLTAWELFVNPGARGAPSRETWPYLLELGLAHYQFETIHPFRNGNGRLGRALVNVAPVKDGFLRQPVCNLSEWVQLHRQEYYERLLRVSTHGQWEEWLRFFATALAEQAQLDLERAIRMSKLHARYRELATGVRKSILLSKLIDHLFVSQVITVSRAKEVLGLSYTAAQRHVEFLVQNGVLQPADDSKYDKAYYAKAILKAIRGQGED